MKMQCKYWLLAGAAIGCLAIFEVDALARGRGGGGGGGGRSFGGGGGGAARPSMGHYGGGGGRPSSAGGNTARGNIGANYSGGGSRPSGAQSHQNFSRPSMGSASHPNVGNVGARPAGGGQFHPAGGGGGFQLPQGGAGAGTVAGRPTVHPPSSFKPVNMPVNRTGAGAGLAGGGFAGGNRPGLGNVNRLPAGGGLAGGNRPPGVGPRPGPGNGNRPGIGGNRPNIGGGNFGGRGNVNIGGGTHVNVGNHLGANVPGTKNFNGNFSGNHPGWNHGAGWNHAGWDHGGSWNHPGWGLGHGGWAGNWHNNCINGHYGWYNGCWHNYWGSGWYAPLAWGAVGWGLGSLTSGWGYGSSYYNPYYSQGLASAPYDYSQPVAVNSYYGADDPNALASNDPNAAVPTDPNAPSPGDVAAQQPAESPEAQQALSVFDDGLAKFKAGDYTAALDRFNAALKDRPGDPVVHEVRALTLFALGNYQEAGAALNSFLSSAPGMDWTTMSSLYGNTDDYTAQLRKLEHYCGEHRDDAAAYFVLAYQYLTLGSKDTAIKALEVVVKNQPKDVTAKRMLDALAPSDAAAPPASATATTTPPAPSPGGTPSPGGATAAAASAPETDLVGTWRATAAGTVIDLTVTPDSQFTWKATQGSKPPVQLQGQLTASSDALDLESKDQGNMSGNVKSQGPDKWQFVLSGAPPNDPGLSFSRVKS